MADPVPESHGVQGIETISKQASAEEAEPVAESHGVQGIETISKQASAEVAEPVAESHGAQGIETISKQASAEVAEHVAESHGVHDIETISNQASAEEAEHVAESHGVRDIETISEQASAEVAEPAPAAASASGDACLQKLDENTPPDPAHQEEIKKYFFGSLEKYKDGLVELLRSFGKGQTPESPSFSTPEECWSDFTKSVGELNLHRLKMLKNTDAGCEKEQWMVRLFVTENFEGVSPPKTREGAKKDIQNLKELLGEVFEGYHLKKGDYKSDEYPYLEEIGGEYCLIKSDFGDEEEDIVHYDLTKDRMLAQFDQITKDFERKGFNRLLIVFSTHGDKDISGGCLKCKDGSIDRDQVKTELEKLPPHVPKMLVIQACRGKSPNTGRDADETDGPKLNQEPTKKNPVEEEESARTVQVPLGWNFLICESTIDKYLAHRNKNYGSRYLCLLVYRMLTEIKFNQIDVPGVLLKINCDFGNYFKNNPKKGQMPIFSSTMPNSLTIRCKESQSAEERKRLIDKFEKIVREVFANEGKK